MEISYWFGRIVGTVLRLGIFAYITWDMAQNINKSESLIVDIIALVALIQYTVLMTVGRMLSIIIDNTHVVAVESYNRLEQKKTISDFQKLLDDFGTSEWTLDKD